MGINKKMRIDIPSVNELIEAQHRIEGKIKRTPILTSLTLNNIFQCELLFKCENFQKVGAFKFRGATNAVLNLPKDRLKNGVATHSSGNHAAALSLAAQNARTKAYIVMPKTAPKIKQEAVRNYGGEITFCEPNQKAREEKLKEIVKETNAEFIHPYDNHDIICGQSTCAKEIFEEYKELDYIITPIGGGGLLSGTCLSAKYFSGKTKVVAAEPKGADDAYRSIRDDKIYPSVNPQTIADGLLTSLSERTFTIIKENIDEIITVSEENIITAMKMIYERMKIVVEPSSAVALSAIITKPEKFKGKKIALILTGGNVDLTNLPWLDD